MSRRNRATPYPFKVLQFDRPIQRPGPDQDVAIQLTEQLAALAVTNPDVVRAISDFVDALQRHGATR